MSIRLIVDVWDFGPEDPIDTATLAVLGNFANEKGLCCYPSIETVSRMTRRSIRTTQRSIAQLANEGWIKVIRGNGRKNLSSYVLNVQRLKEQATKGVMTIPKGCQSDTLSGDQNEVIQEMKGCQPVTLFPDDERVTLTTKKGDSVTRKGDSHDAPIENPKNQDRTGGIAPSPKHDFPEGLAVQQYISGIFENRGVVAGFGIRDLAAQAIKAIARANSTELHDAAAVFDDRVAVALAGGEEINNFWFTDGKWRGDQGRQRGHRSPLRDTPVFRPPTQEQLDAEERSSYTAWLSMSERYKRENPWKGRVFA